MNPLTVKNASEGGKMRVKGSLITNQLKLNCQSAAGDLHHLQIYSRFCKSAAADWKSTTAGKAAAASVTI